MLKLFTCKWVGNCKLVLLCVFLTCTSFAEQRKVTLFPVRTNVYHEPDWTQANGLALKALQEDRTNGLSYIISGSIALIGGIAGANVTSDPLERGVYALFQTIGVASIGYGAYKWKIGDEKRLLMNSLRTTPELNDNQKLAFLKVYEDERKRTLIQERSIRAVTHGLIAALNFYNASQQKQDGVKNTLYFVGIANTLASVSYSF